MTDAAVTRARAYDTPLDRAWLSVRREMRTHQAIAWSLVALTVGVALLEAVVLSAVGLTGDIRATYTTGVSMEPAYHEGDLLVMDTGAKADDARVGDVVVFQGADWETGEPLLVSHRVVRKTDDGRLVTKGDNNAIEDTIVTDDGNLEGVVKAHVAGLGWVVSEVAPYGDAYVTGALAVLAAMAVALAIWLRRRTPWWDEVWREHAALDQNRRVRAEIARLVREMGAREARGASA